MKFALVFGSSQCLGFDFSCVSEDYDTLSVKLSQEADELSLPGRSLSLVCDQRPCQVGLNAVMLQ